MKCLVGGAGGFIGSHLVARLKADGHWVRGIDLKEPEFAPSVADDFMLGDLSYTSVARRACAGVDYVFALAADMGGMGFLAVNDAHILATNLKINLATIDAARSAGVSRYFFASSACVYNETRQTETGALGLREADAYPAQPDTSYGWEKLTAERLCLDYAKDFGMTTRVARFHNVMGPMGTWTGGREKAPAAICRKVAEAKLTGSGVVEVWGDGEQTRSFCYIDDCLDGVLRLMASDYAHPLNIGSDESVSINAMVGIVAAIAGVKVEIRHVEGPQGVRGRNSDNTLCKAVLGWAPSIRLADGLAKLYPWVEAQVARSLAGAKEGAA